MKMLPPRADMWGLGIGEWWLLMVDVPDCKDVKWVLRTVSTAGMGSAV